MSLIDHKTTLEELKPNAQFHWPPHKEGVMYTLLDGDAEVLAEGKESVPVKRIGPNAPSNPRIEYLGLKMTVLAIGSKGP